MAVAIIKSVPPSYHTSIAYQKGTYADKSVLAFV